MDNLPTTHTRLPARGRQLASVVRAYEDGNLYMLKVALDAADFHVLNDPGPANIYKRLLDDDEVFDGCAPMKTHEVYFDAHDLLSKGEPGNLPATLLSCVTWVTGHILRGSEAASGHPLALHKPERLVALYDVLVKHPKIDVNAMLSADKFQACLPRPAKNDDDLFELTTEGYHNDCMTALDYAWRATSFSKSTYPQALLVVLVKSGKLDWYYEPCVYDLAGHVRNTCASVLHMAAYNRFKVVFDLLLWSTEFPLELVRAFVDAESALPGEAPDPKIDAWIDLAKERIAMA